MPFRPTGSTGNAATATPSLGVVLPAFGSMDGSLDPGTISSAAVYGDANGLDGLWLADHLLHPLPLLESIVTLEHVASVTSRVRIGTAVMLLALRSPLVAAKQLATIALLHPGRLTVGVGVGGEHPAEFEASSVPLKQRATRLEGSVGLVRELWSGQPVTADGSLHGAAIKPTPPPIPLLFGGHTPKALRRAARLGDAWVGFHKDVEGFVEARDVLQSERKQLGAADRDFGVGMVIPTVLGPDNEAAEQRIADLMRGASTKDFQSSPAAYTIAGTPDRALERLAAYHAAGCDHFILALMGQGDDYLEQLRLTCQEVLPALRRFTRAR